MRERLFKALSLILIAAGIVWLDQWSKILALETFTEALDRYEAFPFLNFVLRFNKGISYSFFNDLGGYSNLILGVFNSLVLIFLTGWVFRINKWPSTLSMALVIGGGIGNIIDRIRHGAVIDFIDFHINNWHFAVFNIADSFITIGITCFVLMMYIEERRSRKC